MKRNKYLNTFDNTADYENYIESAFTGFPNVGLTKDNGELHYMRTSPNAHVLYGEVVDPAQAIPTIYLSDTANTSTLDELNNNIFYLDSWSNAAPTRISFNNKSNIKTIKKMQLDTSNITSMEDLFRNFRSLTSLDLSNFDTSNVTSMRSMFYESSSLTSLDLSSFDTSNVTDIGFMFQGCSSLTSLDLSSFDTSSVTNITQMFFACSSLKDVYITSEATLNKLTNNLTEQGLNYIPSSATIHYNGTDYKWQNSRWTPQN